MIENSISKSDLELINKLSQGIINKDQFVAQSEYKANYPELKELLFLKRDKADEENNNSRFRNLFYYLPHVLSKDEEVLLNGELLLEQWHHEHEEIVTSFQVIYNDSAKSVDFLVNAFKNVPAYINNISELRFSYQRKIIYALVAQKSSSKIEALKNVLNGDIDDDLKQLILRQLTKM